MVFVQKKDSFSIKRKKISGIREVFPPPVFLSAAYVYFFDNFSEHIPMELPFFRKIVIIILIIEITSVFK